MLYLGIHDKVFKKYACKKVFSNTKIKSHTFFIKPVFKLIMIMLITADLIYIIKSTIFCSSHINTTVILNQCNKY